MALLLPKTLFIHIPKTGGCACRQAIEQAFRRSPPSETGSDEMEWVIERFHACYGDLTAAETEGRSVIAAIRSTRSWYESLWCHKHRHRMNGVWICADDFWIDDFQKWVMKVTRQEPGACGQIMHKLLNGCDLERLQLIRFDWLMPDLVKALTNNGEKFNALSIYSQPPINCSSIERRECNWTDEMTAAVAETEGPALYPQLITAKYGSRILA